MTPHGPLSLNGTLTLAERAARHILNNQGARTMRTKVSENGVLIPKDLLTGITEVDIRKQNGVIMVIPAGKDDPIYDIGKEPVACGVPDASENLDKYLYGGE